ncbi:helix-turn-helix transcriptional regulator [Burkholderia multivorans]|uniref:helix-turn-helix transcriptional regulator n=1 Tax=Burkholderia multivorans TaxID=87883 RepID=UPI000CFE747F|nr:helix-turn-helix transcriptional regulator [Burkholderia multivorans]MBR7891340.1 helix-turn-helix transcriptional regulator [Burkholderia multivorans]MBR8450126.1 helix-turn-helix transcriptional regulator [Burkholderia multivorans]MBU9446443.1 helix-turn-helix domain-containing protein [Burkholderia multivorans]MCL4642643.1 helix-turn-helix domain-containing protein [Burkholderia multivorans]MDN7944349.1 helix-turn-helix transcriptional regulator [Burkholderia multivorans]
MSFPVQTLAQLRPILVGFRKSAGLTQAQLAARLGVTQQSYAQLEANPSAVSIERLFKVLNVLGVRLSLDPAASADVAQTAAAGNARTRANSRRDSAPADTAAATAAPVAPSKRPARRRSSSAPAATGTAATARAAKTPVAAAGKRTPATPRKRRVAKREDW